MTDRIAATGIPRPGSPRVQLSFVDAGDLYATWRWEDDIARPRAVAIPREAVQPALDVLAGAVPTPRPDEDVARALERAVDGPFGDPARESDLATSLAGALIPARLGAELNAVLLRGERPHVRIQPSRSVALVRWEALLVDDGRRFVHEADVSLLPPAPVRNARGRRVSRFRAGAPVVAALDPALPGDVLGRVLDPSAGPVREVVERLGARLRGPDPAVGGALDRTRLRVMLEGAGRLLYVGHVSGAAHGLDVRLHLSDAADAPGRAEPVGAHRPLSAADIVHGDRDGPWRAPARVALLACASGGDHGFVEPSGLVSAFVRRGTEHVAAARWTLPTDAGIAQATGSPVLAFSEAVRAVDDAQDRPDPVAALGAWQRAQAEQWAATGDPARSPLLWAAFTTAWAP